MKFSILMACDEKLGVSKNGKLPWSFPEDLAYFQEKTENKIVIMGRKTWESLPKMLQNRLNIVVSKNPDLMKQNNYSDITCIVLVRDSIDKAMMAAEKYAINAERPKIRETFFIGGPEIIKQILPYKEITTLYLTRIPGDYNCDCFFPNIDSSWTLYKKTSIAKSVDLEDSSKPVWLEYRRF